MGRNKLRRAKDPKIYVIVGIIAFVVLFLAMCYYTYCLFSFCEVNEIPDIFSQDSLMGGVNYLADFYTETPITKAFLLEILKIQATKFWWLYACVPFVCFLMATSGSGREYRGIEKGSADWANKQDELNFADHTGIPMGKDFYATVNNPSVKEIGKKPTAPTLSDTKESTNKSKKHSHGSFYSPHNLNECVIGGSGAGKSFRKIQPDIMQMYGSLILTDPKGELYRNCAKFLTKHGYKVKVLNLLDIKYTDKYNPFAYMGSR
jgi:hypothetical protein